MGWKPSLTEEMEKFIPLHHIRDGVKAQSRRDVGFEKRPSAGDTRTGFSLDVITHGKLKSAK